MVSAVVGSGADVVSVAVVVGCVVGSVVGTVEIAVVVCGAPVVGATVSFRSTETAGLPGV